MSVILLLTVVSLLHGNLSSVYMVMGIILLSSLTVVCSTVKSYQVVIEHHRYEKHNQLMLACSGIIMLEASER
jgi:hypothetical protein